MKDELIFELARRAYGRGIIPLTGQWQDESGCACFLAAAALELGMEVNGFEDCRKLFKKSRRWLEGCADGFDDKRRYLKGEDKEYDDGCDLGEIAREELLELFDNSIEIKSDVFRERVDSYYKELDKIDLSKNYIGLFPINEKLLIEGRFSSSELRLIADLFDKIVEETKWEGENNG